MLHSGRTIPALVITQQGVCVCVCVLVCVTQGPPAPGLAPQCVAPSSGQTSGSLGSLLSGQWEQGTGSSFLRLGLV